MSQGLSEAAAGLAEEKRAERAPLTSSARPKRHHPVSSSEVAAAIFASVSSSQPASGGGALKGAPERHHGDQHGPGGR